MRATALMGSPLLKVSSMTALLAAGVTVYACSGRATEPEDWKPAGSLPGLLEPTDLGLFNDRTWSAITGDGWQYLRRTSTSDDDTVIDKMAPFSPQDVLRIVFTPDMQRDSEPSVHWIRLPRVQEVLTGWWMKLSPNWTPSPAGAAKMTFLWTAPDGQVYSALFGSTAPHHVSINTEWAPYGQKIWDPNATVTPIVYDRWYRVEWYMRWETAPGAADGIIRWWIDGTLNGHYHNVAFPKGGRGFNQFEFAPTVQIPPPEMQFMYIGRTRISTR